MTNNTSIPLINTAAKAAELYNDLSDEAREFIDSAFDSLNAPAPYEDEINQSVYDYAANKADGLNAYRLCDWLTDEPASFDYMEDVLKSGLIDISRNYRFYDHACAAVRLQVENDTFEDLNDIRRWYLFASVAKDHPEISEDAADEMEDIETGSFDNWSQLKDKADEIIGMYSEDDEE